MRVVYRIQSIITDFCPSLFLDCEFPLPYFVGFSLILPSSAVPISSTEARTFVGTQIPRQPLFIIIITSDTGKTKL